MSVYLIHFNAPFHHARHYLGFAEDVDARVQKHRTGAGARLLQVVNAAGIAWQVARVWPEGTRDDERRLKAWKAATQLCPLCRAERLARLRLHSQTRRATNARDEKAEVSR